MAAAAAASPADSSDDGSDLEGLRIALISPSYNTHVRAPVHIAFQILRPDEEGPWEDAGDGFAAREGDLPAAGERTAVHARATWS